MSRSCVVALALLVGCAAPNEPEVGSSTSETSSTAPPPTMADTGSPSATTTNATPTGPGDVTTIGPESGTGSDPETSSGDTTGAQSSTEAGTAGELQGCLDRVDAVEFDNTPPDGETRVPTLGAGCIDLLDGEPLWNYHCRWCHSTLDNNDINERTVERITWAVVTSEALGNWPEGDLADNQQAQDRIRDALLAAPPAVTPDHPHPLPEYE